VIFALYFWNIWTAVAVALNVALYVERGHLWSLGSAIFCGLLFVLSASLLVREAGR
jgi:hypothetical protein